MAMDPACPGTDQSSKVRALHRRFAVYGHHGPAICMDPIAQARSKVGGDEDLRGKQNIVPLGMRF